MRLNNSARQLVFIIIDRAKVPRVIQALIACDTAYYDVIFGRGTVRSRWLKYLGLDDTERAILLIPYLKEDIDAFLDDLEAELQLQKPGSGIAFAMDTDCIFGCPEPGQTNISKESIMHKLITIMVDDGFAEDVMDVARAAGAKGGTIVHARGTTDERVETLFGMEIQPQREILYILAEASEVPPIEEAVVKYLDAEHAVGMLFKQDVIAIRGLNTNV